MPIVRRSRPFGIALVLVALLSLLNAGIPPLGPEGIGGPLQARSASAFEPLLPPVLQNGGIPTPPSIIAILIGLVSNFDPLPNLSADGRGVVVTGHVNCSFLGETAAIEVVLTQASTGASGVGTGRSCAPSARADGSRGACWSHPWAQFRCCRAPPRLAVYWWGLASIAGALRTA